MSAVPSAAPAPAKPGLVGQIAGLPFNYWVCNVMEMLERLAFFSVLAIRPMFARAPASENGLELNYVQIGSVFAIWAWLQCIIPMVSGGYTDRYGYRKSLIAAFALNIGGYLLLARSVPIAGWLAAQAVPNASFFVLLGAACLVATGTAVFKPAVQGTLARVATAETSSLAWGIFYWVVNLGGFIAPIAAAKLRGEEGLQWHYVFYGAAVVTTLNFLPALLAYREPERMPSADTHKGPVGVFTSSLATLLTDLRFVLFLLIVSCFWFMFMQLWDLMPNFIDEWVDTRDVAPIYAPISRLFGLDWVLPGGQVKPEMIINIDAASIILLVLAISWMIRRMHKIAAMILGMIIALVGFVGAGATTFGAVCCIMIFVFAVGEMICSPTFSAYVGLIAPPARKALYMGYSNIPFAIGWGLGNFVSGVLYENTGSKETLARQYLVQAYSLPPELVGNKKAFPGEQVVPSLAYILETGDAATVRATLEIAARQPPAETGASEVENTFPAIARQVDDADIRKAADVLWREYQPQRVWYYLGAFGLVGTVGMTVFYVATRRASANLPANAPPPR